ncbi:hypothetical protein Memar_2081 [Methanoculleus marisnigri JR1]|uniref:Uncharacterized protein n=2 Tax=Methanoculleus TaxID=45989 RepID=A3CXA6_METMJ|nr:hypothetical protein Memar_2081 [Methanoculleus marisnigri JR1]
MQLASIRDSHCGSMASRDTHERRNETMKPKFLSGIGALFAALLIVGAIFVPAVSAQPRESVEVVTTDEATLSLIDELWGTDITIGEYLEKVHPEFLTDMSDDEKADVYQRKMTWSATNLQSTNTRAASSVVVHAMDIEE